MDYDLVVVGAGMGGLILAKTYLQVHPGINLVILDSAASIGGVWAKERIYPDLRTNHAWTAYEFSDFPMQGYGLKPEDHIPGHVMHTYLGDFARKFDLERRVQLMTSVEAAAYLGGDGWRLTLRTANATTATTIRTQKLVLATGLSSQPSMPTLSGAAEFARPLFHAKDFAQRATDLNNAETVFVLGGGKSAMDVVFHHAHKGRKVHWLIRQSGRGPNWTSPIRTTPFKIRTDKIVNSRIISWYSPCIWADDGYSGIRRFFQHSWLGQLFCRKFLTDMRKNLTVEVGYDKHPETAKLKPWTHLFWHGAQISALNFGEDFMGLVRSGQVQVHVSDIDHLSDGTVHLANGTALAGDGLICATGWRYRSSIVFEGVTEEELGLPSYGTTTFPDLVAKANAEINARFPILHHLPKELQYDKDLLTRHGEPVQPFRLFRFTVPPQLTATRNFAFCGLVSTVATIAMLQTQALWIVAYFHNDLTGWTLPSDDGERIAQQAAMQWESILHSEFSKRRTPFGTGRVHADMSPDSVPFLDVLFRDLELPIHRKGSWWKEIFQGYVPQDYRGLVEEWLARKGNRKQGSST